MALMSLKPPAHTIIHTITHTTRWRANRHDLMPQLSPITTMSSLTTTAAQNILASFSGAMLDLNGHQYQNDLIHWHHTCRLTYQVLVRGSYTSTELTLWTPSFPPMAYTFPLRSHSAKDLLGLSIGAIGLHVCQAHKRRSTKTSWVRASAHRQTEQQSVYCSAAFTPCAPCSRSLRRPQCRRQW
jgi:hypothetical protein